MSNLTLSILKEKFAICKYDKDTDITHWLTKTNCQFISITRTPEEISIVCDQSFISQPETSLVVKDWRALKIEGLLDFTLTGILSEILQPLAEKKISIFALSTYDTDYILVKEKDLLHAVEVLQKQYIVKNAHF